MLCCYVIGVTSLFVHRPPPLNFPESFVLQKTKYGEPSMFTCESATVSLNQVSVKHIRLAKRNSLAYFTFAQSSSILFCNDRTFLSISDGRYGLHPSVRNLSFTPPIFPSSFYKCLWQSTVSESP